MLLLQRITWPRGTGKSTCSRTFRLLATGGFGVSVQ